MLHCIPKYGIAKSQLVGVNIIVCDFLPVNRVQVRFPRSKKKRMRKKWAKRNANWEERHYSVQMGGALFVTNGMMDALRKKCKTRVCQDTLVNLEKVNRDD